MTTSVRGIKNRGGICPESGFCPLPGTLSPSRFEGAFTLLEVLLALAITGLMAAITVPLLLNSSATVDQAEEDVRGLARKARASAIDSGEARWLVIGSTGIEFLGSGEIATLPKGWTLQVRRSGEARFRKPRKSETFEFNGEGICEPLSLRLQGPAGDIEMGFDPLTALEPPTS